VLSVRVGPELVEALQSLADAQGTSVSDAARRLLTEAVARMSPHTGLSVRVVGLSATVGSGAQSSGGESKLRTAAEFGIVVNAV
jgi:hypothetical protein